MTQPESALQRFTRLVGHIAGTISSVDEDSLEKADQRNLKELKRLAADCRLDIRDWEYADTRYEREIHAKNATERLTQLRIKILAVSELGIFGPADVAQLSAQIDAVASKVK